MKVLNAIFYIYRHIRPDTGEVFYIGLGRYQKKWKYQRAHTTKNRNIYWQRIVNKCKGHFTVDILLDNLTQDQAVLKEKLFINVYGRSDLSQGTLCNMTKGGEGVGELSKESRKKISNSRRGEKNPMYGKKQSSELIAKRTGYMKGSGNPNFGKKLPEYQKEINRKAQLGRKQSQETIQKRTSQIKKKVKNLDTGMIFESISDCAKYYHKSACHMTRLIKQGFFNLKFI